LTTVAVPLVPTPKQTSCFIVKGNASNFLFRVDIEDLDLMFEHLEAHWARQPLHFLKRLKLARDGSSRAIGELKGLKVGPFNLVYFREPRFLGAEVLAEFRIAPRIDGELENSNCIPTCRDVPEVV